MRAHIDRSWAAALAAGICIVVFSAFLFAVARSFRAAVTEIAEAETRVTVVNPDGSVYYDTDDAVGSHATREEVLRAFADGHGTALRHSATLDRDFLYCARRIGDRVVRLAIPYTGVISSERLVWIALASAGVLGACTVLLVFLVTRQMSRRLDEQTRRLEVVAAGERFRREFTSNVTHELKSPLTAILGAVEMLGDGSKLAEGERRDLFDIIRNECGRLASLVGDVLSLAQLEREELESGQGFVALSLSDLVSSVVEQERIKAHVAHVSVELVRNESAHVRGEASRLEEALRNLIGNALRYSGSESVDVSLRVAGPLAEVSVTDYGIGVPPECVPHLFERFYRVSKSRSRSLGGTGLGLAIVKHIVRLHGGDVFAVSQPGVRTTFGFRLPLV